MPLWDAEPVQIDVPSVGPVSALIDQVGAERPFACYVLAHGAGAGMSHPFMVSVAHRMAAQGVAVLRFQFPYMEANSRRPDPTEVCVRAVRSAVAYAKRRFPATPVFAGGKSFGGRMTSHAEAAEPMELCGLIFFGFPLHPPGAHSDRRADHLAKVNVPQLFLQGTRDRLADLGLVQQVISRSDLRSVFIVEGADHGFAVLRRSGLSQDEVLDECIRAVIAWMHGVVSTPSNG